MTPELWWLPTGSVGIDVVAALMMLANGPVVGLLSGLVLGLFAYVVSRVLKPATS